MSGLCRAAVEWRWMEGVAGSITAPVLTRAERAYAWRAEPGAVFHRVRPDDASLTVCKLRIDTSKWRVSNKLPDGRRHCGGVCFFGATVEELTHR